MANRPMWWRLSANTVNGLRRAKCRNFISIPSLARSTVAVSASFAAPGPTKRKSRSRVSTSSRKTAPLKLAQQLRISYAVCAESHRDRWTRDAEQPCRFFFSGFVDAPTTIKPPGERLMADTLSSDGKKVVQALYDAIAAGDVERFFSVPG